MTQQTLELVRTWGDVNTDGLLENSCLKFQTPEIEGFIGYKVESSHAVVLGDPVCAPENAPQLALAFQNFCDSKKFDTVYTIVSQEFSKWAEDNLSAVSIEFGKKFILNPQENPTKHKGPKASLLRRNIKHASKEGVIVLENLLEDPNVEQQIESIVTSWLKHRHGPQIYISRITLFKNRYGKRWFYAQRGDQICGLLVLNMLQAKEGWLLSNVLTTQDAPNGTSDLLVISALQTLEKENCHYVLVGPVAGKQIGSITGAGFVLENLIRWIYKGAKLIFPLGGSARFWEKFQPQSEGCYVLFPQKKISFSSVKAFLKAYNVGKGKG